MKGASQVDLQRVLLSQFKEESLCDVILTVGMEQIHAHRCVLAAMSPYFKAMFTGHFKEKDETVIDMSASFQDKESLRSIISFMYGSEIDINGDNVEECVRGAHFFQIPELTLLCFKFLLASLRVENCLGIYMLSDLYNFQELSDKCCTILMVVFPEVFLQREDTLRVPLSGIVKLLKAGVVQRCKQEEIILFLERYLNLQCADAQMKRELYMAAGLDSIDFSICADEEGAEGKTNVFAEGSENQFCKPVVTIEQEEPDIGKPNMIFDHHDKPTGVSRQTDSSGVSSALLCWQNVWQYPDEKEYVIYSLALDKWYVVKVEDINLSYNLSGFATVGSESKQGAVVFSCGNVYSLYNLSTRRCEELPMLPGGIPERTRGEQKKSDDAVYKNDAVGAFYLSGQFYVLCQSSKECFYPGGQPLCEIKLYILQVEKESRTWKFVCYIQEFHGVELPEIKCEVIQLSDKEAFVVMKQSENLFVYKASPEKQHVSEQNSMAIYQKSLNLKDYYKFGRVPMLQERRSEKDKEFEVFERGSEIYIIVGWRCTMYDPLKNEFVNPGKSVNMLEEEPSSKLMEGSGKIKYGSSVYTPEKGRYYCIGTSKCLSTEYFSICMVEKCEKGNDCVSRKCPIFGNYRSLFKEKPKILHVEEGFFNSLTPVSPVDYIKPMLPEEKAELLLEQYTARVRPLDELILNEHRLDSSGRCFCCACKDDESEDSESLESDEGEDLEDNSEESEEESEEESDW